MGFADVPVITSQLGGGCLLVAHAGETSARLARNTCEYLVRMQSRLLGVVLNRISSRRAHYQYYDYGYNYGYGQRDGYAQGPDDRVLEHQRPANTMTRG